MIELQEHNGKLKVENYGLMEWATDVQSAVQQGYELDTSNEGWPQVFGSVYTCLMIKTDVLPVKQAETPELLTDSEVEDTGKDARPSIWDSLEPVTGAQLYQDQLDVAQEETEKPNPLDSSTIVATQETPEVDQPVKRGPKPKNK